MSAYARNSESRESCIFSFSHLIIIIIIIIIIIVIMIMIMIMMMMMMMIKIMIKNVLNACMCTHQADLIKSA